MATGQFDCFNTATGKIYVTTDRNRAHCQLARDSCVLQLQLLLDLDVIQIGSPSSYVGGLQPSALDATQVQPSSPQPSNVTCAADVGTRERHRARDRPSE